MTMLPLACAVLGNLLYHLAQKMTRIYMEGGSDE